MKNNQKNFLFSALMLLLFLIWTVAVCFVDVQPIGPGQSCVGFAEMNSFVHNITGVNMKLYIITDWLSLVPAGFMASFALRGLLQLIKRKKLSEVDHSILALGVFYIIVFAVYILFEIFIVNYRPVLINGYLEASYPSSTTVLVLCVMLTANIQLKSRIKNNTVRCFVTFAIYAFIAFMVICRLVSGVHWFSDIVGGCLLSAGLVMMYYSAVANKNS